MMNYSISKKLYSAIRSDNYEAAQSLLDNPKIHRTINEQHGDSKETCLYVACQKGLTEIVQKMLCIKGINLNLPNHVKETPLHSATRWQNAHIVRMLLHAGSGLLSDVWGSTPLHFASAQGNTEILKYILSFYEVNIDDCKKSRFGDGNTALHLATSRGHLNIVKLLLKWGAKTDIRNGNQCTPLHLAVHIGHLAIVKTLVKHGAKLNRKCKGKTVNDLAIENNFLDIAKFIKTEQTKQKADNDHHRLAQHQDKLPLLATPRDNVVSRNSTMFSRRSQRTDIELPDIQFGMVNQTPLPNTLRPETVLTDPYLFYNINGLYRDIEPGSRSRRTSIVIQDPLGNQFGSLENGLQSRMDEQEYISRGSLSNRSNDYPNTKPVSDSMENRLNLLQSRISDLEHRGSISSLNTANVEKLNQDTDIRARNFYDIIIRNFEFLVRNITASEHLDYLFQNCVITMEDYEDIENGRHTTHKARLLLRTLLKKRNKNWVFVFVQSLQRLPDSEHIIVIFNKDSRLNSADHDYKF